MFYHAVSINGKLRVIQQHTRKMSVMPYPTVRPVSYSTTNLTLLYTQYHNSLHYVTDVQYSIDEKRLLWLDYTTKVNFQLHGTGNWSKRPPPLSKLNYARLKENLLLF